jgi:hypothetical protein
MGDLQRVWAESQNLTGGLPELTKDMKAFVRSVNAAGNTSITLANFGNVIKKLGDVADEVISNLSSGMSTLESRLGSARQAELAQRRVQAYLNQTEWRRTVRAGSAEELYRQYLEQDLSNPDVLKFWSDLFEDILGDLETIWDEADRIADAWSNLTEEFLDTYKTISDFGKSDQQLWDARKAEADALAKQLATATDPDQITKITSDLLGLVNEGWNSLTDAQKALIQTEFQAYLDQIAQLADRQFAAAGGEGSLTDAISKLEQPANVMSDASILMMNASEGFLAASAEISEAAAILVRTLRSREVS